MFFYCIVFCEEHFVNKAVQFSSAFFQDQQLFMKIYGSCVMFLCQMFPDGRIFCVHQSTDKDDVTCRLI